MHLSPLRYKPPKDAHFLAVFDPGKTKAGLAVYRVEPSRRGWLSELVRADTLISETVALAAHTIVSATATGAPVVWCVERPQRYYAKPSRDRALDTVDSTLATLHDLAGRGKWCHFLPARWKGNVPKQAHHPRVLVLLSPGEVLVVGKEQHDKLDAIGLGLFATGRAQRGGLPGLT